SSADTELESSLPGQPRFHSRVDRCPTRRARFESRSPGGPHLSAIAATDRANPPQPIPPVPPVEHQRIQPAQPCVNQTTLPGNAPRPTLSAIASPCPWYQ